MLKTLSGLTTSLLIVPAIFEVYGKGQYLTKTTKMISTRQIGKYKIFIFVCCFVFQKPLLGN